MLMKQTPELRTHPAHTVAAISFGYAGLSVAPCAIPITPIGVGVFPAGVNIQPIGAYVVPEGVNVQPQVLPIPSTNRTACVQWNVVSRGMTTTLQS